MSDSHWSPTGVLSREPIFPPLAEQCMHSLGNTETALEENEELLRSLGGHAPALAMFDCEMRYLFATDRWRSDYGLGDRDLSGVSHYALFPELPERWKAVHRRCLQGEVLQGYKDRFERPDGSELRITWEVRPWYKSTKQIGGLVIFAEIVTDRVSAEGPLRDSEMFYRATFNTAAFGIAHLQLDGHWLRVNEAVCRILGYSREELLAKTFDEVTHPEDVERNREKISQLQTGAVSSYELEKRYIRKTGEPIWIHLTTSLLRDNEGHPQYFVKLIQDISDEKQAQAALLESESRFRALSEAIPQLVWMTDHEGHVRYLNRRWYAYTGLTPEQALGEGWQDALHPDERESVLLRWQEAVRDGTGYEIEHRLRGKDGTYRWFLVRGQPIRGQNETATHWFGTCTDISDQKRAEETLRKTEKIAATARLAASVAHQINNPLASVVNALYLARMDPGLSEQTRAYLRIADQELARVAEVTTQSLKFHKQATRPGLNSVTALLDSAFSGFATRFGDLAVNVSREYSVQHKLYCYGDELRQVFSMILGNSLDAIRLGGRLRIRARECPDSKDPAVRGIRITVAENGRGIPKEIREHLFEPFVTSKEPTGTGLGLWVTAGIVRKHGGVCSVRSSTEGGRRGTTFSLFLPFAGVL